MSKILSPSFATLSEYFKSEQIFPHMKYKRCKDVIEQTYQITNAYLNVSQNKLSDYHLIIFDAS